MIVLSKYKAYFRIFSNYSVYLSHFRDSPSERERLATGLRDRGAGTAGWMAGLGRPAEARTQQALDGAGIIDRPRGTRLSLSLTLSWRTLEVCHLFLFLLVSFFCLLRLCPLFMSRPLSFCLSVFLYLSLSVLVSWFLSLSIYLSIYQ